mmetsp:Transcript_50696/g.110024  ORF Transcript_50696/g.110024 Transcript_50696/m.110024 type:complete len:281 (+) Transcript_50696:2780-3622(+)
MAAGQLWVAGAQRHPLGGLAVGPVHPRLNDAVAAAQHTLREHFQILRRHGLVGAASGDHRRHLGRLRALRHLCLSEAAVQGRRLPLLPQKLPPVQGAAQLAAQLAAGNVARLVLFEPTAGLIARQQRPGAAAARARRRRDADARPLLLEHTATNVQLWRHLPATELLAARGRQGAGTDAHKALPEAAGCVGRLRRRREARRRRDTKGDCFRRGSPPLPTRDGHVGPGVGTEPREQRLSRSSPWRLYSLPLELGTEYVRLGSDRFPPRQSVLLIFKNTHNP